MDIVIRPASTDDIPRMRELLAELFSLESDFTPDNENQARGLGLLVNDPSGVSHALVVVREGTVIAMATIQTLISTAEGDRVGLVEDVIVDQEFRGQGIGALLLERLMEWGQSRNLKRIQLLADRENHPALVFYEKHGWNSTSLICLRKMF
jgi:GNAT superfamily N-acetyltransferase